MMGTVIRLGPVPALVPQNRIPRGLGNAIRERLGLCDPALYTPWHLKFVQEDDHNATAN